MIKVVEIGAYSLICAAITDNLVNQGNFVEDVYHLNTHSSANLKIDFPAKFESRLEYR